MFCLHLYYYIELLERGPGWPGCAWSPRMSCWFAAWQRFTLNHHHPATTTTTTSTTTTNGHKSIYWPRSLVNRPNITPWIWASDLGCPKTMGFLVTLLLQNTPLGPRKTNSKFAPENKAGIPKRTWISIFQVWICRGEMLVLQRLNLFKQHITHKHTPRPHHKHAQSVDVFSTRHPQCHSLHFCCRTKGGKGAGTSGATMAMAWKAPGWWKQRWRRWGDHPWMEVMAVAAI